MDEAASRRPCIMPSWRRVSMEAMFVLTRRLKWVLLLGKLREVSLLPYAVLLESYPMPGPGEFPPKAQPKGGHRQKGPRPALHDDEPALGSGVTAATGTQRDRERDVASLRRGLRNRDRTFTGRLVRSVTMQFSVLVEVSLRPGIADPEGATIERALPALGFDGIANVRAGKAFRLSLEAPSEADALARATSLAERLLSNPVIEQSHVHVETPR